MIDIQVIRDNPDKVKQGIANKNLNPDVIDEVLRLDEQRRELLAEIEALRARVCLVKIVN